MSSFDPTVPGVSVTYALWIKKGNNNYAGITQVTDLTDATETAREWIQTGKYANVMIVKQTREPVMLFEAQTVPVKVTPITAEDSAQTDVTST